MNYLKKILALLLPSFPMLAFADSVCPPANGLCNPLGYSDLTTFLAKLLELVAQIGFPIIVLFVVYVGFQFIAAEGNPEKLAKARQSFFWVLVGALIVLGAEALSLAIQATVTDLQQGIPQ